MREEYFNKSRKTTATTKLPRSIYLQHHQYINSAATTPRLLEQANI
jgi:hypothetical protein